MKPIVAPGRIVGLDVARCLALVGMIATHTLPALEPNGVTVVQQVAGGRSAALFALLAGVSLSLMSGRRTPLRGQDRLAVSVGLVVRAALIALVGLLLGSLGSGIAIILTYYGVLFLMGIPFLGLRARALAVLSGVWLCVVPVLSHLLRPHLPERDFGSPVFTDLVEPVGLLSELLLTGYYPAVPWLAYLFAGMAVGRLDLSRWSTAAALTAVGAGLAAISWSASTLLLQQPGVRRTLVRTFEGPGFERDLDTTLDHGLYGTTPTGSWWWLAVDAPHTGTTFDLAHTIGTALVVIGLALILGKLVPRLAAVVFGAGAMTLTLYSLHVVLRTPGAWFEDGTETFWKHTILVLVVGAAYRLFRASGPLERMVALLSRTTASGTRR